ncbi:MAG: T9SS type A sorting domain-containing protein, partial [candidate division Zixibacteria bacterium]|nr:T9SS type A sorting domain-containing protein [candidate division Zixibacteria bacterium]
DGASGTAAMYDIRYATPTITSGTWTAATQVGGEPSPRSAGSAENFTVTGLEPDVTYFFAIRAADEVYNWSPLSNIAQAAALGDTIPPSAVFDLGAGLGDINGSVEATWTAPGDDGLSGSAASYDFRYSTDPIDESNWSLATSYSSPPAPLAAGDPQTLRLENLTPGVVYHIALKTTDNAGNESGISNVVAQEAYLDPSLDVDDGSNSLPESFAMEQSYPNPFNQSTIIRYSVPQAAHVNISVYDILGRKTRTLINEAKGRGNHLAEWRGTDSADNPVASGVYIYRMASEGFAASGQMVLLK